MKGHCRDCGHDNPEDERYCQACNADLAYQDIMAGNGTERQTVRYRSLKEAVDKTTAGHMSPQEFASFLQGANSSFQEKVQALMSEMHEAQYDQESPEEVNVGLDGVHHYEEAMHELYLYVQDHNPSHLEHGLEMAWEANEQIVDAMRLNRETRQTILEEFTRLYEDL